MSTSLAALLRTLFKGAEGVYGTYVIDPNTNNGTGKVGGKALTVKKPVTQELWDAHVAGKQSIGIIPICADNSCVWGVIDIDQYPPQTSLVLQKIKDKGFPLNPCFSKSGGLHLFLFTTKPVSAAIMQKALRTMSNQLGLAGCEIFPKQTSVNTDKGEIGNWLNMPFFGNSRLGIDESGSKISLETFLDKIKTCDPRTWAAYKPKMDDKEVPDGPPCLQAIVGEGALTAASHNRNNVMMAMAVYFRKAYPDDWDTKLTNFNNKNLKPPLPASELEGIRKRVREKDYTYQCSQDPIRGYCNRPVCLTRKYGIQGGHGEMVIDNVTQIKTGREALWLIRMNGVGLLELDTPSLLSQNKFGEQYFNTFRTMPASMKIEDWKRFVSMVGEQAIVIEDIGFGTEAKFRSLLKKFVEKKTRPEREAVLRDSVWIDRGAAWFTALALAKFLELQRFTALSPGALNHAIKQAGGEFSVLRVGYTTHRAIRFPLTESAPIEDLPDLEGEAI